MLWQVVVILTVRLVSMLDSVTGVFGVVVCSSAGVSVISVLVRTPVMIIL